MRKELRWKDEVTNVSTEIADMEFFKDKIPRIARRRT
jgi:hypothetical protein